MTWQSVSFCFTSIILQQRTQAWFANTYHHLFGTERRFKPSGPGGLSDAGEVLTPKLTRLFESKLAREQIIRTNGNRGLCCSAIKVINFNMKIIEELVR